MGTIRSCYAPVMGIGVITIVEGGKKILIYGSLGLICMNMTSNHTTSLLEAIFGLQVEY
jgi:hypothetical protein